MAQRTGTWVPLGSGIKCMDRMSRLVDMSLKRYPQLVCVPLMTGMRCPVTREKIALTCAIFG